MVTRENTLKLVTELEDLAKKNPENKTAYMAQIEAIKKRRPEFF